jgi:hypothetical protein
MFKVSPNYSTNLSFIQVSSLPIEQQVAFMHWIPETSLQQLTINNITMTDCVDYQEYNYWFDFQFHKSGNMLETSF